MRWRQCGLHRWCHRGRPCGPRPFWRQVRWACRSAILGNGKSAKKGWAMEDYHPSGAVGQADAGAAQKGQAVVEAAGQALAALLAEVVSLPWGR